MAELQLISASALYESEAVLQKHVRIPEYMLSTCVDTYRAKDIFKTDIYMDLLKTQL